MELFFHQIFLKSYFCSHVCSQCHQASSAAFSEWLPKQWWQSSSVLYNAVQCSAVQISAVQWIAVVSLLYLLILINSHILHQKPFDFNTLKNYMKRGHETEKQTFWLLDRSSPRADSVKTTKKTQFFWENIWKKDYLGFSDLLPF